MEQYRTNLFLITLSLVYFFISILQFGGLISLSEFYIFALSFSSILFSVSDTLLNITRYLYYKIGISVKIDLIYRYHNLNVVGENGGIGGKYNIFYIQVYKKYYKKDYDEELLKKYEKFSNKYSKASIIIFALGIAVFLTFPFVSSKFISPKINSISSGITTLAFAMMSFNLYFTERLKEVSYVYNEIKDINCSPVILR